ncbi:MAG: glutamate 5-kinase [Bacteroidales bacterium]|nr:glutamate 5-kinase [Bacteroidales bacterium]
MKNTEPVFNRVAIKVGSNVITKADGSLNEARMLRIVEDVAILCKQGIETILVTSGAVAAGRNEIAPSKRTNIIEAKQMWAAIGQVKLMSNYRFLFGKYGIQAAQVLATKESFGDRMHYLNMKNCISAMLDNKVLPIVNENDTISVNELMFTDNDELSGLISSMMDCNSLILLTNVDGIFTGIPSSAGSELIKKVDNETEDIEKYISESKSVFGRGGMSSKSHIAKKIASQGIDVFIANGLRDSVITDIVRNEKIPYTHFVASCKKESGVKKWISHSEAFARGAVTINAGAREALTGKKPSSLLMVGITRVHGTFEKGDVVSILDEDGNRIGLGKSYYDSEKAEQHIGEKMTKPFIHYHFLVLDEKTRALSAI